MASSSSSSSLSISPTASNGVPPGFLRPKSDARRPLELLTIAELKAKLAGVEQSLKGTSWSPSIREKLTIQAQAIRDRLFAVKSEAIVPDLDSMHIHPTLSSSPPSFMDGNPPVILRTKARVVARPLNPYGSTQGISFAEAAPLESAGWHMQKERERQQAERREKEKQQMEKMGISREDIENMRLSRALNGETAEPGVMEAKMWAFMRYRAQNEDAEEREVKDDDELDYNMDFSDDDDEYTDHTTEDEFDRDNAILPGSDDDYGESGRGDGDREGRMNYRY